MADGDRRRQPRAEDGLTCRCVPADQHRAQRSGDRRIEEELQSHLDEAIAQGRDPAEARQALGSALRHREESLDAKVALWVESIRADVVFGWRHLMKKKVTTSADDPSLALAGSARAPPRLAIDAVLLRPLPVGHAIGSISFLAEASTSTAPFELRRMGVSSVCRDARAARQRTRPSSPSSVRRAWRCHYASDDEMEKAPRAIRVGHDASEHSGCGPPLADCSPAPTTSTRGATVRRVSTNWASLRPRSRDCWPDVPDGRGVV